jgi:phosphopantothenoylcysteine decarboxylase/phosphopantothenate--cysteine ligase
VVVSAGGTREPLDPVRFLGNRSSGLQGYALAAAAAARGSSVHLVSANVELVDPAGVTVERVGTALELEAAVRRAAVGADVVVMAAAVADFRPGEVAADKIKKGDAADDAPAPITLVRNPDVLAGLVAARGSANLPAGCTLIGFAAETGDAAGDALSHARAKLTRKGVDLLVLNDVSGGAVFGQARNTVHLLAPDGSVEGPYEGSKADVAHSIWDRVVGIRARST